MSAPGATGTTTHSILVGVFMANVLLVDDEPDFVAAAKEMLQLHGHTVESAEHLESARRLLGGMVPDVTVRANGEIDPIDAGSWMTGIEQRVSRSLTLSGYYSRVSAEESFSLAEDAESYIGYGYPGSSNSNNKRIQEVTGVFAWEAWKLADRGSMQLNIQTSWLTREPWSRGNGPGSPDAYLFLAQVRYNLP